MRELALRLPPGADLRRALEDACRAQLPQGGFVVCGIGSLADPRLRLAGQDAETAYPGPYELLTLSGTVAPQGAHLHASIASASGQVAGGHVLYGNVVRTTAEVLVVALQQATLSRAVDPATGCLELVVDAGFPSGDAMRKPFVNLDEVEFTEIEDNGRYASRRAPFSDGIGARRLGYNLTVLPPGKAQCPFHSHRAEEEMFLILDGEGELRFGDRRWRIRRHDVIACPTGGPEVAHQIINTGSTDLRYLALSNRADVEVCQYPDSDKLMASASEPGTPRLWTMVRAESGVDYYDREIT